MSNLLGVLGLVVFCTAVIGLAAGITYVVIKLGPGSRAEKQA